MSPDMEAVLSIGTLAVAIWSVRVLLPRAVKEDDPLALGAAVLTLVLAVLLWFFSGYVKVW